MSHDDVDRPDDAERGDGRVGAKASPAAGAGPDDPRSNGAREESVRPAARPDDASAAVDRPAARSDINPDAADQSGPHSHGASAARDSSTSVPGANLPPLADDALDALSAFVDGELPSADAATVRERIAADPIAASRVCAYRAQKAALQALCEATGGSGASSGPTCIVLRPREPWWWRAGIAAGWVAAGAGLAFAASAVISRADGGGVFFADDGAAFARRADVAYAVYSPEQRHPVEVGAADETHLVAWLSKRLGRTLSVPSLQDYGYALVGGRLLPGGAGPAAQFMYENDGGERLTLYVSAAKRDGASYGSLRDGDRRTFYWTTGQTGYALSGTIAEGKLRTIAADVCSALGGDPARW